jgi:hemoglobin-like flavoprotein
VNKGYPGNGVPFNKKIICMTQQQVYLVQQSWEWVKPIAKEAGLLFYEKLFVKAPGIRHLFKADITEQANKLVVMLGYVVVKLHRIEDIVSDVQQLGARHNQYGAKPEHYDVVGQCLIETLRDGLGSKWNNELEQAWLTAFTILKTVMIEAQQKQEELRA